MTGAAKSPVSFDVGGGKPLELTGWEGLSPEAAERFANDQFTEQLDRATMYRMAFTTEAGRYVLQDMIDHYLSARIVDPAENSTRGDGIRQGRVDVVGEILHLIQFANTGGGRPPEPTE